MKQGRHYDYCPDLTKEEWDALYKKYPHFPKNKDIGAKRLEYWFRLPAFIEDFCAKNIMKDPRDVIMLSLIFNVIIFLITLAAIQLYYPYHIVGIVSYFCVFSLFLQRFILMMHYAEHRPMIQKPFNWAGKLVLNLICPFIGIPPGFYRLHHVVMHHIENNVFDEDLSSTEPYQRDNYFHFLIYYYRYWTHLILLPIYAIKKERYGLALFAFGGGFSWFACMCIGMYIDPMFTFYTFVFRAFCTGYTMMHGNFSQHIFINPKINEIP